MIPEVHLEKRLDRIRSYILRAGRTTAGQQRAIHDLGPHFLLTFQEINLNLQDVFAGSTNPKILEISFGMGKTAAKIAVGSLNPGPLQNLRFLFERAMESGRSGQSRSTVVERVIGVQARKRVSVDLLI